MSESCPCCDHNGLGGQIVELPHAITDDVTYGAVCPNCGNVYASDKAQKQMGGSA